MSSCNNRQKIGTEKILIESKTATSSEILYFLTVGTVGIKTFTGLKSVFL